MVGFVDATVVPVEKNKGRSSDCFQFNDVFSFLECDVTKRIGRVEILFLVYDCLVADYLILGAATIWSISLYHVVDGVESPRSRGGERRTESFFFAVTRFRG